MDNKSLIPEGFKDDVDFNTNVEHEYKNKIIDIFLSNGFDLVKTPLLEFYQKNSDNVFIIESKKKEPKLKVLEIGAINTHLLDVAFMDTMAIDLNSCNHRIKQIDFLKLKPRKEYDVVVSSMVINCVPTKELRLKMLLNIY